MLVQLPAGPSPFNLKAWLARALAIDRIEFHAAGRSLRLVGNQHLKLQDRVGTEVQLVCGAAWITQEGDIKDHFIGQGERFLIEREGETLIAPLGTASLRLMTAPECGATAHAGSQ